MALITKDAIDEIIQKARQTSVGREDIVTLNNAIHSESSARKLADKVYAKFANSITCEIVDTRAIFTCKWSIDKARGIVLPYMLAKVHDVVEGEDFDEVWQLETLYMPKDLNSGITINKDASYANHLRELYAWILIP